MVDLHKIYMGVLIVVFVAVVPVVAVVKVVTLVEVIGVTGLKGVNSADCYIYFSNCNLIPHAHKHVFKDNTMKNNYDNIDGIIRVSILNMFYPIIQFLNCHRV